MRRRAQQCDHGGNFPRTGLAPLEAMMRGARLPQPQTSRSVTSSANKAPTKLRAPSEALLAACCSRVFKTLSNENALRADFDNKTIKAII